MTQQGYENKIKDLEKQIEAVENIAKEDGIFYEWLYSGLPTNEYEDFVESITYPFWEKSNKTKKQQ